MSGRRCLHRKYYLHGNPRRQSEDLRKKCRSLPKMELKPLSRSQTHKLKEKLTTIARLAAQSNCIAVAILADNTRALIVVPSAGCIVIIAEIGRKPVSFSSVGSPVERVTYVKGIAMAATWVSSPQISAHKVTARMLRRSCMCAETTRAHPLSQPSFLCAQSRLHSTA